MLPGIAPMMADPSAAGGGGGVVSISDRYAIKGTVSAPATASYSISIDGHVKINGLNVETWLNSGIAAGYDVRATLVSGTAPAGSALAAWLNLSSSRTWSLTRSTIGNVSCVLTIEIGLAGSGAAIDSATITIEAERDG